MNPWIDVAGWALVHFVWQGAWIAAIAYVLLALVRGRSAQTRYAIACAALIAMLAVPAITAAVLSRTVVAATPSSPTPTVAATEPAPFAPPDTRLTTLAAETSRRAADVSAESMGVSAWLPLVVALWMIGVVVLLVRLCGGWWRISRLHRAARAAARSSWATAATRIAATLGLVDRVHVVDTPLVDTPTVIGWVKPVILLPIAAFAGLSPAQVEAILAHELAHIRRHDFLVNLLQTFAETVLFYHPAVWWISARIRTEREHCCDVVALSVCGDAVSYAEALVELETWRTSTTRLAVAATGGTLLTRVRRLLGAPADDRPRSFGTLVLAGVVALVVCVAGASRYLVAAQSDAPSAPPAGNAYDPAAWSMTFNHADSAMRFIGFRGRDLIRFAYQVPVERVVGGPRWIDEQILQIVVNLDAEPSAEEMPGIVRQALEERLQLKAHIEQRNFPVLALVMARRDRVLGPNLRVSSRPCFDFQAWVDAGQPPSQLPSESRRVPWCGGERDSPLGRTQYVGITMPQFAEELRDYVQHWPVVQPSTAPRVGPHLVEMIKRPHIFDRTGLSGRYDLDLNAFYPTAALMSRFPFLTNIFEPLGFTSIPRALDEQLGLRLVQSEAPYDVIVIDHAEQP